MNCSTPVVYCYLFLCLLITLPGVFSEEYYELFNVELPHHFWWQSLILPFQHGVKGMPLAILGHLVLNIILLLTCGRITESILGRKRFLFLSIVAWVGFTATAFISDKWVSGASGVIWAYSPFLLIPIKRSKKDFNYSKIAFVSKGLLVVMWGLITVVMVFVPLVFNPEHKLMYTFLYGNLYHAVATFIGFMFYGVWRIILDK